MKVVRGNHAPGFDLSGFFLVGSLSQLDKGAGTFANFPELPVNSHELYAYRALKPRKVYSESLRAVQALPDMLEGGVVVGYVVNRVGRSEVVITHPDKVPDDFKLALSLKKDCRFFD